MRYAGEPNENRRISFQHDLSNPILCPFSLMCSRAMGSLIPNHVLHLDEDGATAGHSSHATRNPKVVG